MSNKRVCDVMIDDSGAFCLYRAKHLVRCRRAAVCGTENDLILCIKQISKDKGNGGESHKVCIWLCNVYI